MYLNIKSTIIKRKNNIILFDLSGEPFTNTDERQELRCSDVVFDNLTIRTESDEYFSQPSIYTFRSLYNIFNRVCFYGNGKAIYFDIGSFDMRFMNCEFISNSDIETVSSYSDNFHDEVYYGVNQIMFYGCRWEGYKKGNLLNFKNYTREMYFVNSKFEGTITDNNPILKCEGTNADIFFIATRVTCLSGSSTYFCDLTNTTRCLFEVSYIDNSTKISNPFIKINACSGINLLFNCSFSLANYEPDYYIDNQNTNNAINISGYLTDFPYFANAKKLYSNPQLMNKNKNILDITTSSQSVDNYAELKIRKTTETDPLIWKFLLNFHSYNDNISQLLIKDPNGNTCMTLRNGGLFCNKFLRIPYLSEQPSSVTNGDIFIDNYSDSNIPSLSIGLNNHSNKIGWNNNPPSNGYWYKGSIIFNNSGNGCIGWICTQEGTPGTWKQFGTLE